MGIALNLPLVLSSGRIASELLPDPYFEARHISLICRASKYGSGKSSEAIRPLLKTRGKFKAIPIAQNWSGHRNSQRGFARRHNHREHNRGITVRRRINLSKRIVPYVDR